MFQHCSCSCYINNANITDFYTQLSICRFQISCILQFSIISWHNLSETKSTSPEIMSDITENNWYIFAIKCLWRNELCVIYSAYFTIVTKWIGFLEASKQEGFFWTAWPLSQHWRCQIFFKCNIQLNCLSMQHPSKEIQPFPICLFLFEEGVSILHPMSSQFDCERCEKRFLPWPSQTVLALKVTEIHKCFNWRSSTL